MKDRIYDVFSMDGEQVASVICPQLVIAAQKAEMHWPCIIRCPHMPNTDVIINEYGNIERHIDRRSSKPQEIAV